MRRASPVAFAVVALVVTAQRADAPAAQASPGDLDRSFGRGGIAHPIIEGSSASAVALAPDGGIVVVGQDLLGAGQEPGRGKAFSRDPSSWRVMRFRRDGSADRSFGDQGSVVTRFWGAPVGAAAVAMQRDGRIVVAGGATGDAYGDSTVTRLIRYRRDGAVDPSFGAGGKVRGSWAGEVLVQRDRRLLVGEQGGLVRYLHDGSPDPSFHRVSGLAAPLLQGGKIVAGRRRGEIFYAPDFVVGRFLADGSADPSFGSAGIVQTQMPAPIDPPGGIVDLVGQRDGKVVAVGYTRRGITLVRYLQNGSLDPSFGRGGIVARRVMRRRRPLLRSWHRAAPTAAVVQRDGKVVVAGELGTALLVLRFRTDGSLDPGFGTAGKVELAPGRGLPLVGYLTKGQYLNGRLVLRPWARPEGLALQRDGRIVLVGTMGQPDGPPYLFAARLMDE